MHKTRGLYQVSLKVFLKNSLGQILVLKCLEQGRYKGFYDLPGGHIDAEEFPLPFVAVLKREILEEVGEISYKLEERPAALGRRFIPLENNREGSDLYTMYIFFAGEYRTGEIKLSSEHSGYAWVDLKKIKLEDYFTAGILEGAKEYLLSKK